MSDLISRGDAIKAVLVSNFSACTVFGRSEEGMATAKELIQVIKNLPSVQPEPLTDKEQRIFLAAMGREEKVCKQVDEECRDCREPYEDSLVRVCHEIERKVKGALWMI